jgi:hypothetical protein
MAPISRPPDTPSYAAGRQSRSIWETWVAKLVESPFSDGVVFWASNRSLKPEPTCAQPAQPAEWQRGCTREYLTDIDLRRTTDRDYQWGWSSL